jgi:hypothetical protein
VSVVDTRTLRRRRLAIADGPAPGAPSAPAFGPPGTLIVSSFDGFLARVDARTGRVTGRFAGHRDSLFTPTTSADGRIVVTGGFDGTARLWDARSLRQLGRPIPLWLPKRPRPAHRTGSSVPAKSRPRTRSGAPTASSAGRQC